MRILYLIRRFRVIFLVGDIISQIVCIGEEHIGLKITTYLFNAISRIIIKSLLFNLT